MTHCLRWEIYDGKERIITFIYTLTDSERLRGGVALFKVEAEPILMFTRSNAILGVM